MKIIKNDLESKGYEVSDINFQVDYKYESDSWGRFMKTSTFLKGATATVVQKDD